MLQVVTYVNLWYQVMIIYFSRYRVKVMLLRAHPSPQALAWLSVCYQHLCLVIPIQYCCPKRKHKGSTPVPNDNYLHNVHGLVPLDYLRNRLSRNLFFDISYNVVTSEHTILNDNVSICGFSDDLELTLLYSSRDASTAFCQSTVKEKPEPLTIDRTTAWRPVLGIEHPLNVNSICWENVSSTARRHSISVFASNTRRMCSMDQE